MYSFTCAAVTVTITLTLHQEAYVTLNNNGGTIVIFLGL